jgi:hypothetical protein
MIDLTDYVTRVNLGVGLALVALLLALNFFVKFPGRKVSSR